jgi:hypothetical protein
MMGQKQKKQGFNLYIVGAIALVMSFSCKLSDNLLNGDWVVSSTEVLLSDETKLLDSAMSGFYENKLRKYFPGELRIYDTLSFSHEDLTINGDRKYRFYINEDRMSIINMDMIYSYNFEVLPNMVRLYREKDGDLINWYLVRCN